MEFPDTAEKIQTLALDLVRHLQDGIKDTHTREEWSSQNFKLLQEFAVPRGAHGYSHIHEYEFLWDFTAFLPGKGILLAAESEWLPAMHEIVRDFEKLLYVRSPLKLMMCRIVAENKADEIKGTLEEFLRDECASYSAAEVFILYCVWWAGKDGCNRDIPYMLQISGQPDYKPLGWQRFQRILRETR